MRMQAVDGFGAAVTSTSAHLLQQVLGAQAQAQVTADLFARPAGIGLSMMRVPMGSSDFSACSCTYSYDDGAADPTLAGFSTSVDDAYVIPALRQALAVNPRLEIFANPWSPPAWMKTDGSMLGTANGAAGTLVAADLDPLAQYFVRFLQEYAEKGVPVWGIPPGAGRAGRRRATARGSVVGVRRGRTSVGVRLGPALADAGLSGVKVLGGDDVGASFGFAQTLFDSDAAASALSATAWHCYAGLGDMTAIHDAHPSVPVYMTECSTGPTGIAGDTSIQVILAMSSWASGAVLWNLALDPSGGPKMGTGCVGCTGLVTIDETSGAATYTINYPYELGQFSKFVAPGAARVTITWAPPPLSRRGLREPGRDRRRRGLQPVRQRADVRRRVRHGAGSATVTLPPGATVTLTDADVVMGM